jgi:hypothetical protein
VNAGGTALWNANGLLICDAVNSQTGPRIEPDGANGALIAWIDKRNGVDYDVYAQRVSSTGTVQWTSNGVAVCSATNNQSAVDVKYIGSGGLLVAWKDSRASAEAIYAQLVSLTGSVQMAANGVKLSNSVKSLNPNIVADGLGGGIIAWEDSLSGTWDITAQKINSAGVVQWTTGGVTVSNASGNQVNVSHVGDSNGGAIYAWEDYRNASNYEVYAQYMDASGMPVIGLNENAANKVSVILYPNPAGQNSTIKIIGNSENIEWEINVFDISGKLHSAQIFSDHAFEVDALQLTPGTYIYEIKVRGDSFAHRGKLILLD